MNTLEGNAASRGIVIVKAYRLVEQDLSFEKKVVSDLHKGIAHYKMH